VQEQSKDKVDAIYELREAVEQKVHAEVALERDDTPQARDALLDATLDVEAKTQDAIEICHECGHAHASGDPHIRRPAESHARASDHSGNVVTVDFRQRGEEAER
jgi:hypothetical protein